VEERSRTRLPFPKGLEIKRPVVLFLLPERSLAVSTWPSSFLPHSTDVAISLLSLFSLDGNVLYPEASLQLWSSAGNSFSLMGFFLEIRAGEDF